MEPLWSPVVATGGNQRQIGCARKRRKQAKTVAVGCDRLRAKFHGKEGVSGSSPEEGLKYLQICISCCLFRRGAGARYGGGQRDANLQALLPRRYTELTPRRELRENKHLRTRSMFFRRAKRELGYADVGGRTGFSAPRFETRLEACFETLCEHEMFAFVAAAPQRP